MTSTIHTTFTTVHCTFTINSPCLRCSQTEQGSIALGDSILIRGSWFLAKKSLPHIKKSSPTWHFLQHHWLNENQNCYLAVPASYFFLFVQDESKIQFLPGRIQTSWMLWVEGKIPSCEHQFLCVSCLWQLHEKNTDIWLLLVSRVLKLLAIYFRTACKTGNFTNFEVICPQLIDSFLDGSGW